MTPPASQDPLASKRASRIVIGSLATVALIVLVILGLAIAAMTRATHVADEEEAAREHERVLTAIHNELLQNAIRISAITTGGSLRDDDAIAPPQDDHAAHFKRGVRQVTRFDGAYLVDRKGQVRAGAENDTPADESTYRALIRLIGPLADQAINKAELESTANARAAAKFENVDRYSVSRLYHDGRNMIAAIALPVVVATAPENPADPAVSTPAGAASQASKPQLHAIVGYRIVTQDALSSFARRNGLTRLRIGGPDEACASLCLPLKDDKGVMRATLNWHAERPGSKMLPAFMLAIAVSIGICLALFTLVVMRLRWSALQLARREDEIQRLAGHDPLSGLPNRRAFERAIDAELERTGPGGFAVHFLDLDKFKAVNDTYGHKAGDELIRQVAKRLTDLLRGADTLVRLGGDEFAIIQTEVMKATEAAMLGQRILEALTRPFTIGEVQVLIGVSIGISLASQGSADRETIVNQADTALYQAKNEGRNRYHFFEKQMDKSLHMRRVVEDDLRDAIAENQLELHYQPQISADGRTILGVEALVRWPHKTHGMIPPTEFIPIAEERGLIMQLSDWVLRRACLDGLRWPHLRLAVNVSPIQFRHHDFVANVAAILAETGFDGSNLELELTEGVVVDDADKAEAAMIDLRALGIGLALDDFGTGYSSLIYLRRFAFDKIKIDRSFLEYMETTGESAILVHSVVHLGRALGLRVCAEGVETAEQHRFLQAVGCHELQGYFFSRPITAQELDALMRMEEPFAGVLAA